VQEIVVALVQLDVIQAPRPSVSPKRTEAVQSMGTKFSPCKVTVVPTEYALATFGRNRETTGAAKVEASGKWSFS
jgi:hypothetical protein